MKVPKVLSSVKYNLAVVNGIFVLTGIILLIVGILVLERNSNYDELITYRFFVLPALAVGTGVFIIFISVLGSFAAISEKFYFIIAYVVLMLIVLVLELSVTITAFKLEKETSTRIRAPMEASLKYYETKRDVTKIWDDLQRDFQCCGVDSVNSWHRDRIPLSCCYIEYGTTSEFRCNTDVAYAEGCRTALGAWLSHNAHVLAVTVFILTCIQAVLVGISSWLAWRAKSKY
ncbi:tetraspanin-9-like [Choristoneura fumiferana]|uniref:tetraspanin-9-like n=1 Tax=Choristoneura fumiferana TaxID=7141 RepID=UPI003D1546EB